MSEAQARALGMLTPAAGVAAMQGLLLDLAAARSPRAAGETPTITGRILHCVCHVGWVSDLENPEVFCLGVA